MKHRFPAAVAAVAIAIALAASMAAADSAAKSVVTPVASVTWTPAGVPGVSIAPVEGDMTKGPSHFYLKYDAGFSAPMHHHSPDHYGTVVSGAITLTTDGKETKLGPGSYFALLGKAPHAARVEGKEACVMFIDARGPWDVVMQDAAKK